MECFEEVVAVDFGGSELLVKANRFTNSLSRQSPRDRQRNALNLKNSKFF